jgi:hypothetical protein
VLILPAGRGAAQLDRSRQSKLLLCPGAVRLDGLVIDVQDLRDLRRTLSSPEEAENLQLAIAQLLDPFRAR